MFACKDFEFHNVYKEVLKSGTSKSAFYVKVGKMKIFCFWSRKNNAINTLIIRIKKGLSPVAKKINGE